MRIINKYLYNAKTIYRPVAQFWLERRIDIAEVDGSSPFGSTSTFKAYSWEIYPANLSLFITNMLLSSSALTLTVPKLLGLSPT